MKALCLIIFSLFSLACFAQDGTLDSTFSDNGILSGMFTEKSYQLNDITTQPDGKIIATGSVTILNHEGFGVYRFNADGTTDSSFGSNGIAFAFDSAAYDQPNGVAVQSDGKIVVAGNSYYYNNNNDSKILMARFNANGTFDSSFGTNGIQNIVVTFHRDEIWAIALQPDGKIVAAGYSNGFAVFRFNTNGILDSTFNADGAAIPSLPEYYSSANSVVLQADGKIAAVGFGNYYGYYDHNILARYNTDGSPDNNFGTNGIVLTTITSGNDEAFGAAIQPDQKIVTVGFGAGMFEVVRYNIDGSLDSSFGDGGAVLTIITGLSSWATDVEIQPDNKIVASGVANDTVHFMFALLRCNVDGSLDSTFGTNGKVATDIYPNFIVRGWAMALQPDGKILECGGYTGSSNNHYITIARYKSGLALGTINFSSSQSSPFIYPNPIHQTETLEYNLEKNESLTISLYDVNGKLIKNFISNEQRSAGTHKEMLSIGELTSGNYFLTISNGSQKMTVKMVKQ